MLFGTVLREIHYSSHGEPKSNSIEILIMQSCRAEFSLSNDATFMLFGAVLTELRLTWGIQPHYREQTGTSLDHPHWWDLDLQVLTLIGSCFTLPSNSNALQHVPSCSNTTPTPLTPSNTIQTHSNTIPGYSNTLQHYSKPLQATPPIHSNTIPMHSNTFQAAPTPPQHPLTPPNTIPSHSKPLQHHSNTLSVKLWTNVMLTEGLVNVTLDES